MKRILFGIILLLVIGAGIGFAFTNGSTKNRGETMDTNSKILIAYFSWGGNTKSIAQKIQAQTGGDLFEIETKEAYPTDYAKTTEVAKKQKQEKIHPELKNNGDVSNYDVIFVGTPAWWYTMAPAVMTFLENNNFEGKTVVPFITHGGGGEYKIASEIGEFAKGSKILKQFVVYEKGDSRTEGEIKSWLKEIGF